MKINLLIGVTAGIASALLYGSMVSGSLATALLFYLAPLPLYIAGLGWGLLSAVSGVGAASVLAALTAGPMFAGLFLLWAGLPALVLIYLALLSRPADDGDTQSLEWYPPGRLFVWICAIGTVLLGITVLMSGPGVRAFQAHIRKLFEQLVEKSAGLKELLTQQPNADLSQTINFLVWILPLISVAIWVASTFANLWISALIARASDRLVRPWPKMLDFSLPQTFALSFVIALATSFLPGLAGLLAGAYTTASLMAFALLGIVTLHVITQANPYRPFFLGTAYAALIFLSWITVPLFAVLGLVETGIGIKARYKSHSGPIV